MLPLNILIILVITFPVLLLSYVMLNNRKLVKLPGPLAVPFLGYRPPSNVKETFQMFEHMIKTYGGTSRVYVGFIMRVLTADINVIEYITKSNVHLSKTLIYDLLRPMIGDGLLLSSGRIDKDCVISSLLNGGEFEELQLNGVKWQRMRKLLTPSFHFSILNKFMPIVKEASTVLVEKLKEEDGKPSVNILQITQRYALDTLAETSMGIKLKTQNYENEDYIEAMNTYLEHNVIKGFSWWKMNTTLYKLFAKEYALNKKCLDIIHRMTLNVIENKYNEASNETNIAATDDLGSKRKMALVNTLFDNKMANGLCDKTIQDEIDTFLFAGFDTTSRALAFAIYELGQHPDVQQKIYEEIIEKTDVIEEMTSTNIMEMKYLDMVVKEIMRYRPPVPFVERKLNEDAVIDGNFFPKGTVFIMLIYWIHRNPQYYPNPEKFDPERFSPDNSKKIPNFAYIPFSAGPRNCIGQKFALLELKSAIIHVIKNFEILPVPGHKLDLVFIPLLDSTTQILVRIRKRC